MTNKNNSSTALQILSFRDSAVRMKLIDGEPWWILNDVCAALDIKNPYNVAARLDGGDLRTMEVSDAKGHTQHMNAINEPALYEVIALSRKPEAKAFKRWVTHEVLPSLRKTGSYVVGGEKLSQTQLDQMAVLKGLEASERLRHGLEKQLEEAAKTIQAQAPKVAYADMVGAAENTLTMPQMAKILSSHGFPGGVVKLYRRLREDHVVYRKNGRNLPCQRYVDAGLFTARISPYEAKGHHYNGVTMLVTPKGSRWLAARYCPGMTADPALPAAPAPTWESACFVEGERGYQGEGYPILHVFNNQADAEDWAAAHDGQPIDNKQGKQTAEDIAGLRVEALGWTWDGTLNGLRALPASDDGEFAQAVADTYALDAGPWTGGIIFHC